MKASPNLDILMGTKIMGWELVPRGTRGYLWVAQTVFTKHHGYDDRELLVSHYRMPATEEMIRKWGRGTLVPIHAYKFSGPDSIAVAWMVVERLRKHALHFDLQDNFGNTWFAEFFNQGLHYGAVGDTAPLAICLAALETLK